MDCELVEIYKGNILLLNGLCKKIFFNLYQFDFGKAFVCLKKYFIVNIKILKYKTKIALLHRDQL